MPRYILFGQLFEQRYIRIVLKRAPKLTPGRLRVNHVNQLNEVNFAGKFSLLEVLMDVFEAFTLRARRKIII